VSRTATFDAQIREWSRQGREAIAWDLLDLFLPWGFRLADILIRVTAWYGSQDPWVKPEDVEIEASTIPDCGVFVWPDSGHLGIVKHWEEILEAVAVTEARHQHR
jgi:pimeloyl-ACP methyl ester carboxylesterase